MAELLQYPLEGGGTVTVEVTDEPGMARVGRRGVPDDARITFERALTGVRAAASAALGTFRQMDVKPDEIEITFGVKLGAEAGAVIARTGVEGNLEVKITWHRDDAKTPTPDPAADGEPADPLGDGGDPHAPPT